MGTLPVLQRRLVSSLLRLLGSGALLVSTTAVAQEVCDGPLSPCVNADGLDLALGPARFASLEDAQVQLEPGKLSLGVGLGYAKRPLSLTAASPDPLGRQVPLVDEIWQTTLLVSVGLPQNLQLGFGLPLRVAQDGGGIDAVTSRRGSPLADTAVVDPRIALGWGAFDGVVAGRARLELTLPLGDERSFAGAPALTAAPSFLVSADVGDGWHLAAEAGARFGETVRLGDVRFGSQLRFALGVRYEFFEGVSLGVEAWAHPSLLEQPETAFGKARHLPAEWMASVGLPFGERFWLQAGAGSGLPLSSQGTRPDTDPGSAERESMVGATATAWRALVLLRVTE